MGKKIIQIQDFEAGGFRFRINPDGKSVTLSKLIDRNAKEVVIPSTVNNYPVTSIGYEAFYGCFRLTSVTIPDSITEISSYAFYGCTGLTSVTIPDSVTNIGGNAFKGTAWFDNQPDGLVYAGLVAYKYKGRMPSDTSIIIKDGTKGIASWAFWGCTGLTSVTIPDSVTSIGDRPFRDCTGLKSVTIGNSVTTIDGHAFEGTAWFDTQPDGLVYAGLVAYKYKGRMPSDTSIVLKDGTKGIASFAFRDCTGLTSVTIPDSVTAIGNGAFSGCSGLTSVNIPDSVKSIGKVAFAGCSGLTSVTIPDSVNEIGRGAFSWCAGLTSIKVDSDNLKYDSRDNCNAIIETATNTLIRGCQSTIIPDSVTEIGGSAFSGCTGLTSVTIPNSVTSIGKRAFSGCTGLTSVNIPNSVTEIGDYAFDGCTGLKQIILTGYGHNSKVLPEEIQKQIEILRIGSGISEIGNLRCNPKEIWCYAEVPPKCTEGVFTGFDAVLHVPQRAAAAYFTADVWRNFTNIVFDANEKLTLSHSSVNMGLLETFQLSATAEHRQESGVVWSSSDPSIATVSEQGVVCAIQPGTCRIYATLADNSAVYASCEVKVDNRVIISLDSDTIQMRAMTIRALEPKFYPRAVDVTVTSSDPGVVLPRKDGSCVRLLGLKAGECRVTLSAPDARPVTVTVVVK